MVSWLDEILNNITILSLLLSYYDILCAYMFSNLDIMPLLYLISTYPHSHLLFHTRYQGLPADFLLLYLDLMVKKNAISPSSTLR